MIGTPTRCSKCGEATASCVMPAICWRCSQQEADMSAILDGNVPSPTEPANSRQVGGSHYRRVEGEQHWDRILRLFGYERGKVYLIGQITKYVERHEEKNGLQDLEKAAHFLQKLIEEERKYQASKEPKVDAKYGLLHLRKRDDSIVCGLTGVVSTNLPQHVTCPDCASYLPNLEGQS